MDLVERDAVLQVLEERMRGVSNGAGHVALVSGEAGIGKTSLLKELADRRADAVLWWGACDALQTPHPLAPLQDIARGADVGFRSLLSAQSGRAALFEAVLTELQQSRRATLVVVEDVHWADEATLDLLKFLGRRIERSACLLVISFRDDELTPVHPLRRLLGELPRNLVTRVDLPRLSQTAVALMARRALRSPTGIYAATHGNPLFVTEMLRNGVSGVPGGVHDLVLARFARLSTGAQAVVRLACLVPAQIERWLVDKLLDTNATEIEECLNSGLLKTSASALCFRHELARVAIERSLPEPVAHELHAAILDALERSQEMQVSLARLVHHAVGAGDHAAVLRYAPEAAHQAMLRGAHREAAAHYRTVIDKSSDKTDDVQRAVWLDAYARACQVTDQLDDAINARLKLGELHRRAGNVLAEAHNLSQLALAYVPALRNNHAQAASRRAIELLEAMPPSIELAGAYRVEAQLRMLNRNCEASVEWSRKAIALAERFEHREILAAAISTLGAATMFIDYDAGCAHLHRALDLALADDLNFIAANTYNSLGSGSGELFRLHEAQRYMRQAIAFANEHEIDIYRNYCASWLALSDVYLGNWDDAAGHAFEIVEASSACSASRVMALIALGRLRARRGDPGVAQVLDEALNLSIQSGALQLIAPARAARAEAAWLRGDLDAVAQEAQHALALAAGHRHTWFTCELAYWMWMSRSGDLTEVALAHDNPFAMQLDGRWNEAAAAWAELGCPFEQARALAEGDDDAQLAALALYEQLGARPAADELRRQMRAAGRKGLPRGARASTQTNPHQLTAREIEVLTLLCEGLKNSQIAQRLSRSVRTIDHHLAAIFAKLGVGSRIEAVVAARQLLGVVNHGQSAQYGQEQTPI